MALLERHIGKLWGGYIETFTYQSNGMTFHDVVAFCGPDRHDCYSVKRCESLSEAVEILNTVVIPNIIKEV